eukprot:m.60181 g.60181  ORF g.60181 m.60181 type:complete len:974 (+) comp19167_c0_seq2:54-2975(+)
MLFVVVCVVLCFCAGAHALQTSYFVAPNGNDGQPGTQSQPFASLARAQQAVRGSLQAPSLTTNITVFVSPGQYFLNETLTFDARDSAPDGLFVRYMGLSTTQTNAATLYHGVKVTTPWIPYQGNIWVSNITSLRPPAPPAPPPSPYPQCGVVEPGYDYDGHDLVSIMVDSLNDCCIACSNHASCNAWSFCVPGVQCGTPGKPVNCYLKSSSAGRHYFGPNRTSGTISPPSPPSWRFYQLLENREGGILARTPNRGSGYLRQLGVKNTNTQLNWPAGALPASFAWQDAQVFCNLGADWFSETRLVTSANLSMRTLTYGPGSGAFTCNDKVYLQGPKELIDEPGEFSFDHQQRLLYYYPRNKPTSSSAFPEVIVPYGPRIFEFSGKNYSSLVKNVVVDGLTFMGGDFTSDGSFLVFTNAQPNSVDPRTKEAMIRVENATNIVIQNCRLAYGATSGIWLEGWAQNITIRYNVIDNIGFCGIYANGIYPGIGFPTPFPTALSSDVNKYHQIDGNIIFRLGQRVGHGGAVWLFQSGTLSITRNLMRESPRNAIGIFGVRFGAGQTLPLHLYNKTLDFFSALDVLHTRNLFIAYNIFQNTVRDTADAGAVELWGVGANNTITMNAFSDMDSGAMDGSWMNFLFADDASHFLTWTKNIVFEMKGKGSEEMTMQKSVGSVFSNNILACSLLGHAANFDPYIEPAANMKITSNIWFNLTTDDDADDFSVNDYTSATLRDSCSLFKDPNNIKIYNFTNTTSPSLNDPVVKELDFNLYYNTKHDIHQLSAQGWDLHALEADPGFLVNISHLPFALTHADFALPKDSPAITKQGFEWFDVHEIDLPGDLHWQVGLVLQRDGTQKIQAEEYHRMRGAWHAGSFAITPGPNNFPFASDAWAVYDNVGNIQCASNCSMVIRAAILTDNTCLSFAFAEPDNVLCELHLAKTNASLQVYSAPCTAPLPMRVEKLFVFFNAAVTLDWFQIV